jgi:hypothetical protein
MRKLRPAFPTPRAESELYDSGYDPTFKFRVTNKDHVRRAYKLVVSRQRNGKSRGNQVVVFRARKAAMKLTEMLPSLAARRIGPS